MTNWFQTKNHARHCRGAPSSTSDMPRFSKRASSLAVAVAELLILSVIATALFTHPLSCCCWHGVDTAYPAPCRPKHTDTGKRRQQHMHSAAVPHPGTSWNCSSSPGAAGWLPPQTLPGSISNLPVALFQSFLEYLRISCMDAVDQPIRWC